MSVRIHPVLSSLDTLAATDTELANYMLSLRSPPSNAANCNTDSTPINSNNNTDILPTFVSKVVPMSVPLPVTADNITQVKNHNHNVSSSIGSKQIVSAEINQYLQPVPPAVSTTLQYPTYYGLLSQPPLQYNTSLHVAQPDPYSMQQLQYASLSQALPATSHIDYTQSLYGTKQLTTHQPTQPQPLYATLPLSHTSYSQPLPQMDLHSTLQQYTDTDAASQQPYDSTNSKKRSSSVLVDDNKPSRYMPKRCIPAQQFIGPNHTTNVSHTSSRLAQGLRLCSARVCSKLQQLHTSTYNDIADLLVAELSDPTLNPDSKQMDEKNIRRRIYDTLNVLLAMQIIKRTKKDIEWCGLQCADQFVMKQNTIIHHTTNNHQPTPDYTLLSLVNNLRHSSATNNTGHTDGDYIELQQINERISNKQRHLYDLVLEYYNTFNLCNRNQLNTELHLSDTYKLHTPFMLIAINASFECYANDVNTHVEFVANQKFDVASDTAVINYNFNELVQSASKYHSSANKHGDNHVINMKQTIAAQLRKTLPTDIYDYITTHQHHNALLFKQIQQLDDLINSSSNNTNALSCKLYGATTPSSNNNTNIINTKHKTPNLFTPASAQLNSAKSSVNHSKRIDTSLASVGLSLFSPNSNSRDMETKLLSK